MADRWEVDVVCLCVFGGFGRGRGMFGGWGDGFFVVSDMMIGQDEYEGWLVRFHA